MFQKQSHGDFANFFDLHVQYFLPSSIHEVLIVDQSFVEEPLDLFALKEAVLEVNYQVVDPSEFLSNEVYEVKGPDFQLEKATFLNHKKEKNMER
jgi:hypothetical protein